MSITARGIKMVSWTPDDPLYPVVSCCCFETFVAVWARWKYEASGSGQTFWSDSEVTSCSSCQEGHFFILASGLTPFLLPGKKGRKEGREYEVKDMQCAAGQSLYLCAACSSYGRGQSYLYLILKKRLCFLALCIDLFLFWFYIRTW